MLLCRDLAVLCQGPSELLMALDTPPNPLLRKSRALPPQQSIVITASNLTPELAKHLAAFAKKKKIKLLPEYRLGD